MDHAKSFPVIQLQFHVFRELHLRYLSTVTQLPRHGHLLPFDGIQLASRTSDWRYRLRHPSSRVWQSMEQACVPSMFPPETGPPTAAGVKGLARVGAKPSCLPCADGSLPEQRGIPSLVNFASLMGLIFQNLPPAQPEMQAASRTVTVPPAHSQPGCAETHPEAKQEGVVCKGPLANESKCRGTDDLMAAPKGPQLVPDQHVGLEQQNPMAGCEHQAASKGLPALPVPSPRTMGEGVDNAMPNESGAESCGIDESISDLRASLQVGHPVSPLHQGPDSRMELEPDQGPIEFRQQARSVIGRERHNADEIQNRTDTNPTGWLAQDAAFTRGVRETNASPRSIVDQITNQILARVATGTHEGRSQFHIFVEPPELGPVRVFLSASHHSVMARLVVQDETARQIVEAHIDTLRQSLSEAGVSLSRLDVSQEGGGSPRYSHDGGSQPAQPPLVSPEIRQREVSLHNRVRILFADRVDVLA